MTTRAEKKERYSRPMSIQEAEVFKFILDECQWMKKENLAFGRSDLEALIRKVSTDYGVDEEKMKRMFIWNPTPPEARW